MTPEEAELIAANVVKLQNKKEEDDDGESIGLSPKFVKQLQNTVGVFNALKDFASNPMQKAIEERVGSVTANVIQNAFGGGQQKSGSLIDSILNSQFAYGFGQSLGSRGPELIESMTKNLGQNRTNEMLDNMMGSGKQNSSEGESKTAVELLLSLDPNNSEHIAAYAESQGGLSIEMARKILLLHQDDILKRSDPNYQMSHLQKEQPIQSEQSMRQPEQPEQPMRQSEQYIQPVQYQQSQQEQVMQQREPIQHRIPLQEDIKITKFPSHEEIQQSEVNNVYKWNDEDEKPQNAEITEPSEDAEIVEKSEEQSEILKSFSEEIGNLMGGVMSQMESMTAMMSNMQSEINTLKGIENAEIVDVHSEVESTSEVSNSIEDTKVEENSKIDKETTIEAASNDEEDIEIEKNPTSIISKDKIRKSYHLHMKNKDSDKDND